MLRVNSPFVFSLTSSASFSTCSVQESLDHYLANYGELLKKWDTVLEEKGVSKVEISDSEIEAFKAKAADPIREEWIADMEAQGLPGQELYDVVIKALEDHRNGS